MSETLAEAIQRIRAEWGDDVNSMAHEIAVLRQVLEQDTGEVVGTITVGEGVMRVHTPVGDKMLAPGTYEIRRIPAPGDDR